MALDTFWIQDAAGGAFDAPHRLARLYVLIEQALSGRLAPGDGDPQGLGRRCSGRRMRAIHVPPRVVIDNRACNTHTVLEVNGRDRPGLLHDVTAAISEQGLQIASRPRHHLRRARGGRVLRQGRVRPEGRERAQAGGAARGACSPRWARPSRRPRPPPTRRRSASGSRRLSSVACSGDGACLSLNLASCPGQHPPQHVVTQHEVVEQRRPRHVPRRG